MIERPAGVAGRFAPDRFSVGWAPDVAALLLLGLATVAFFSPVIFGGAWLPQGGGDLASFIYPMYRFASQSLSAGEIPLWNPYQYAGAPFLADNQSGLFYPINLLLFMFRPSLSYAAVELLVMLHIWWAGAGLYVCLRLWERREPINRPAALFGALCFMFSDVFITHIGNLNLVAVAAWLPLALLCLHRAVTAGPHREQWFWAVTGGVVVGVCTLAGHGQMTFLIGVFLGLYALYRTALDRSWRPAVLLALVAVVAAGASAVSLVPAYALQEHTVRAGFTNEQATKYSLPPAGLIGMFAPGFFGRGARSFWADWDRVEAGYAGVLPWLLAAVALAKVRPRRTLFFAGAGALALLLAMGPHTPVHRWVLAPLALPFQAPARFVLLMDFSLAFLAALGLDHLLRTERSAPRWLLTKLAAAAVLLVTLGIWLARQYGLDHPERSGQMAMAVAVFAVLASLGLLVIALRQRHLSRGSFAALAIFVLVVDVVGLGYGIEIDRTDPVQGYHHEDAISFLRNDPELYRIDVAGAAAGLWQPSTAQVYGLYSIGGAYNPLQLGIYSYYMDGLRYRGSTPYNLLGVRYIVAPKTEPPSDRDFIVPVFTTDPTIDVYLNSRALPRLALLYETRLEADDSAAYEALHDEDFDPTRTLVLHDGEPLSGDRGTGSVALKSYRLNEIRATVETDRPAYLLLADIYHPDWRATVDGAETPIRRADFAFRALYLRAGTHEVAMRFEPPSWRLGAAISAVTWLVLLGGILAVVRIWEPVLSALRRPSRL